MPRLNRPADNDSSQDHQYIGACPVVPPSHCGYQQGEPSPYLASRVLLGELDFRGLVTLAANDQGPSTPVNWSYPPCSPVAIPLAGTVGSPDFLPEGQPLLRYLEQLYRVNNEWSTRITPL